MKDKRNVRMLVFLASLCAGCGAGDPTGSDTDGVASDTNQDQPQLDGVRVECCFVVTDQASSSGLGCTTVVDSPCVDPEDPVVDLDGDGSVDAYEATQICRGKAPPAINCPFDPFYGPGLLDPLTGFPVDPEGPYCGFVTNGGGVNPEFGSCDPGLPGQLDPFPNSITPPTHAGSFSSAASQVDLDIDGAEYSLQFGGDFEFSLTDCSSVGRHKVCHLDLTALGLRLVSTPTYGDYLVESAGLELSMRTATSVAFACDSAGCSGGFDYSSRTGTDLQMTLEWEQKNLSSGVVGGGTLALGAKGLASMSRVVGELELDASLSSGTIRLLGTGEDNLGGETATATFDVVGSVSPI